MPTYADLLREQAKLLDEDFAKHVVVVIPQLLEISRKLMVQVAENPQRYFGGES